MATEGPSETGGRAEAGSGGARDRLLDGIPVRQRSIQIDGRRTAVLEGGAGPALVLMHGGIECGGVVWAPIISRLCERYRVVIPDAPGLGESQPLTELNQAAFSTWLSQVMAITGDESPTLIAHSLLGTMAMRFAAAHPTALSRLVVYAAPGVGPYRMPFALRKAAILFSLWPSRRNGERFERLAFADYDQIRRAQPDWIEAFGGYTRERARLGDVKRTMRQLIGTCTKEVPEPELRRIAVPTALIWGRADRFVPLTLAQGASERLGWPLRVIDGAGHVPHVERPEAFLTAFEETRVP
jgi:2-hydroxymuconate-semialdehyde hydrolase